MIEPTYKQSIIIDGYLRHLENLQGENRKIVSRIQ